MSERLYLHNKIVAALGINRSIELIIDSDAFSGSGTFIFFGDSVMVSYRKRKTKTILKDEFELEVNFFYDYLVKFHCVFQVDEFFLILRITENQIESYIPFLFKLGLEGSFDFERIREYKNIPITSHQRIEWRREMKESLKNVERQMAAL